MQTKTAKFALPLALAAFATPAPAEVRAFPPSFHVQEIPTDGAVIHVRIGGKGPAVVMLHGFGDTGDMWAPVAAVLVQGRTVVVPDLRGMGLSSHPEGGYEKKTQALDIAQVLNKLQIEKADLVTHDIGNMVGYAFAAQFPARVTRWVVIDAPLPGIGPWDEIIRAPALWHFNFRGPDVERLVKGRERIYLDRFWNELSLNPQAIDGDAAPLRPVLCAPRRYARGIQPIRSFHAGCDRQQGARRQRKVEHADSCTRRRSLVRDTDGRRSSLRCDQCH